MNAWDILRGLALAVLIGALAARKHRSGWEWGLVSLPPAVVFGVDFSLLVLLLLWWIKPLCPQCQQPVSAAARQQRCCAACGYRGRLALIDRQDLRDFWSIWILRRGRPSPKSSRRARRSS